VDWIARKGFLGIDIRFVICGLVIALSISKDAPTFGYFGRFIIRRSIPLVRTLMLLSGSRRGQRRCLGRLPRGGRSASPAAAT
jgi:hypothetical protein